MTNNKIVELVFKLHQKTSEGSIDWRPTDEITDQSFYIFRKDNILTLTKKRERGAEKINLTIQDGNGRIVAEMDAKYQPGWDGMFSGLEDDKDMIMSALFDKAQSLALKTDSVIDEIMSTL